MNSAGKIQLHQVSTSLAQERRLGLLDIKNFVIRRLLVQVEGKIPNSASFQPGG